MNYSTENHLPAMDYSAYYQQHQQQNFDPSSQYYQHPTNNYDYSYSYHHQSYSPQPIPHNAVAVQPQQHVEQEPNPPGVSASVQALNPYYQYSAPASPAAVLCVGPHYQPGVQSSYGGIGSADGKFPQEIPQAHSSFRPNAFSRPFRGRGRGRGRGRAHSMLRPAQDQSTFTGAPHVQARPPQPMPQYSTSLTSGSMPFQGQANSIPPKSVRCKVCNIECDTHEILEQHKNGKKHQKNLKKIADGGQMEIASNSNGMSEAHQVEENLNVQEIPAQPSSQYHQGLGLLSMTTFQGHFRSAPILPRAVSCELCKVDCNTAEIFEKHRNGKKHQKNLKVYEELQKQKSVTAVQVEQASTSELKSNAPEKIEQSSKEETVSHEAANEESRVAAENQKVEEVEPTEESADKTRVDHFESRGSGFKRKMRGGRGGRRARPFNGSKRPVEPPKPKEFVPLICELCNVKCESLVVFQSHLVGKKHQLNAKRFLTPQEILGQEILTALTPALQHLLQQNAIASTSVGPPLLQQGFGPFLDPSAQNALSLLVAASGAHMGNANMETASQLQPISADFIAPPQVNNEGTSNKGHSENQGEVYYPSGSLAAPQMEVVSASNEPVTSAQANIPPLPGPDTIIGQVPSNGADSAQ